MSGVPTSGPLATRLLVIRHGETAWNVESRIQGQLDLPLNEMGRRQAERLGAAIAHEPIAAVYSSDLIRAAETARAVLAHTSLAELRLEAGLRERAFGCFEGQTHAEIERKWPDAFARWRGRDPSFGAEGGETLSDFYVRSVGVAARLAAAHRGQTLVLVAHGGVLDCLYRAATGTELQAPRNWPVRNAAIHRLLHTEQGFSLLAWGDDSHLDGLQAARDEIDTVYGGLPLQRLA